MKEMKNHAIPERYAIDWTVVTTSSFLVMQIASATIAHNSEISY